LIWGILFLKFRYFLGFFGFWVSGFLGFWVSGFQGFRVSGFLGFWVSGFLGFWFLCFEFRVSGFFSGMVYTKILLKRISKDSLLYSSDSVGYYAVSTMWGNPDTTSSIFKSCHELIRVEEGWDVEMCDEGFIGGQGGGRSKRGDETVIAELEWWFKHLVAMFIV
jgi:hypothetical protein